MIFSLSKVENDLSIPSLVDTDIFCFFRVNHAVTADENLWWKMICASLRGKRNVLILESKISAWPLYHPKERWQTGDNWSWLTPRSLSVISSAYDFSPMSFQDFKSFLTTSK